MLPLVTSQAIALSKSKQGQAKAAAPAKPATAQPEMPAPVRPGLLRRVLAALVPIRLRRPEKPR